MWGAVAPSLVHQCRSATALITLKGKAQGPIIWMDLVHVLTAFDQQQNKFIIVDRLLKRKVFRLDLAPQQHKGAGHQHPRNFFWEPLHEPT